MNETKVKPTHLSRLAYLYIRQSSLRQVFENRESTARQYDFKRRALSLGWSSEQIVVIDEDLGLSGASASERDGFQRLVADVGLGRVGVAMGLEVSRLARSSSDWHRLIEISALSNTLILDEDGIYDPSHFNDRLLLGLKGTMSEAELYMLRARLVGGALNKARRGELWIRPPIGFVYDSTQKLVFDPDLQIQNSVRLFFDTFRREGSALGVVRYFAQENLKWPRRIKQGKRAGEVVWGILEHNTVLNVLHNPRYAGAYVYGRYQRVVGGKQRSRRVPREEWKVFIPNAHPGYISWEEFEANEARLLENANAYGSDRRKSPPREGVALLQGLVICGVCGRRMTVRYHVVHGHPTPSYTCARRYIQTAQGVCQVIPGGGIDESVGRLVVEAVTPASLDVALQVFEELRLRKAEVDRIRRAELERARVEAEYAQHQYMLVRPENRLVADSLERQWNEKLVRLAKLEEEHAKGSTADDEDLSPEAKQRIQALASDLASVWKDPRTQARDKKRMLRLLIEDVTLKRGEKIQISIRWKGGATTCLEQKLPLSATDLRRTPAAIVEQIRSLAMEQTDAQIAQSLNHRGLRSGTGKPFTRLIVRHIRTAYGIDSLRQHLRLAGWLTPPEMAAQLGVCVSTAKTYAASGVLRALRIDSRGEIFFEPVSGPLPRAQPGKKLRDRQRYPKLIPHRRNEVQYEA